MASDSRLHQAGFPLAPETASIVEHAVGEVLDVVELTDGVVHHVARVVGHVGSVVLKRRGETCARIPSARLRPADAAIEADVVRLVDAHRPGLGPALLAFDPTSSTLVLEDLAASCKGCDPGPAWIRSTAARDLGPVIISVCAELAALQRSLGSTTIRIDNDGALAKNTFERMTYHDRPEVFVLVDALSRLPTAALLGDVSPKNMLVGASSARLYDFESAHVGFRIFDAAFLLAHVVVHRLPIDPLDDVLTLVDAARATLDEIVALDPSEHELWPQAVLLLTAYRFRNAVVPYPTGLPEGRCHAATDTVFRHLQAGLGPAEAFADLQAAVQLG